MMEDLRIEEADKIIKSICIYKTNKIRAVITEDNTLICIYDNTLMYIIKLKCQVILPAVFFVYDNDGNIVFDNISTMDIIPTYQLYTNIINQQQLLLAYQDGLTENEDFQYYNNLKSSDGMKFYKMMGINNKIYMVPMFNGLLGLNKQDTLSMYLYYKDDTHIIVNNKIYKKKISRDINIIYNMLNINN